MPALSQGAYLACRLAARETTRTMHQYIEKEFVFIGLCSIGTWLHAERERHSGELTPQREHVLRALHVEAETVEEVLQACALPPEPLCHAMRTAIGKGTHIQTQKLVHRSTACKTYFYRAEAMAEAAGATEVSCLHLLAAILEQPEACITRVVTDFGVDVTALQARVGATLVSPHDPQLPTGSEEEKPSAGQLQVAPPQRTTETPYLEHYGQDITQDVTEGQIDPIIGQKEAILAPVPVPIRPNASRQRSPSYRSLVLAMVLGLGLGAGALFGVEGPMGLGICLLVFGAVGWFAKDTAAVLLRRLWLRAPLESQDAVDTALESALAAEPPLLEPLAMVPLPEGTFLMGSGEADAHAYKNEKRQHTVTVSVFSISRYPITRQLYREICEQSPAVWAGDTYDDRLPANHVSWFDAVAFCNALSAYVGLQPCYHITDQHVVWNTSAAGYRLPTEAEWEYACRAGTTSLWFFGDDPTLLERYAWFADNAGDAVRPVGAREPNPWGLHDMSGNVWEWCWDWYDNKYPTRPVRDPLGPEHGMRRVLRGGSAWNNARNLRPADRIRYQPELQLSDLGFRCIRSLHPQA